ncbi:LysR family transcriptional regulator [Lentzea sp. NPDC051838]|uniref:LysR family transcriptional regulator n=1 Tax=Lentzea sp. NPDC051838 TaxID=3154849 RepID=UPI00343B746E
MSGVDLRQLRFFVTVAEELHFGKAAARLGVAQPAVSQQIARLEREWNVPLLKRSSRRVTLTEAGDVLLDEARSVLKSLDRLRDIADGLGRGGRGVLRIGVGRGLANRLRSGFAVLRANLPEVELVLVEGTDSAHAAAVAAGELDAAVVRGDVGASGVRSTPMEPEQHFAVLAADHPGAKRGAVRLEEVAGLRLRLPARVIDRVLYDAVHARCAEAQVPVREGRDITSLENALLEIGAGAAAWTVVASGSTEAGEWDRFPAVAVRPLNPPLVLPVSLLLPAMDDTHTRWLSATFAPGVAGEQ